MSTYVSKLAPNFTNTDIMTVIIHVSMFYYSIIIFCNVHNCPNNYTRYFFFFFVVVNELSEELTFHGILMMDDLEWIQ